MTDVAGFALTIVIDCKCFSKKVDVNNVEAFLGFLDDLKVSKGIMITNVGYSQAAYDRATYDTKDIELRIINFSDLEQFQAFWGIPYSGGHTAILSAPDGWVLDGRPRGPSPAFLYPAGLTWEEAFAGEGFIYLTFSKKDANWPDLAHLLRIQETNIRAAYQQPRIEYAATIQRQDCQTRLRVLETRELEPRNEYTIFLDFPDVILFLSLLTPHTKASIYLKKLEWVAEKLVKAKALLDTSGRPIRIVSEQYPAEH